MKGNVWAIAVLFIGFIVLAPALNLAYAGATQSAMANESTAVDYDQNYTLAQQDVENYTSLTVTANNTTLADGTDYEFDRPNGTIDWLNTTATEDGDAAWVNYTYAYYDDTQQLAATVIENAAVALAFLALIAGIGLVLKITGGGWT